MTQERPAVEPRSPLPAETTANDGSPSRRVADAVAPFEGARCACPCECEESAEFDGLCGGCASFGRA